MNFGMIPEFIGRLPIIFTLDGLTEDMLGEDPAGAEECDLEAVSEAAGDWMR